MQKNLPWLLCILFIASTLLQAQDAETPDARMLRFPDISVSEIVFSYAGDLWLVAKEGGLARKLSSPKGGELFPKFSPDGKYIAFSGNYDGNTDVYLLSANGGSPKRLTHHPDADLVVGWYPDGKHILYRSRMASASRRFNRLFKQSVTGGLPEPLPVPYGELASFNQDASVMAFQYISRGFRTWKRYRGGMASDLWLYNFAANSSKKFTSFEGTDAVPMWHGNTIYFLSDRDERQKLNIWAYETATEEFRPVTSFAEYDVKWPSLGPEAIVFENGGKLHVLDLASEKATAIEVRVSSDLPNVRKQLKEVAGRIQNYALSPSGKRALFEARGEIFTVPEKHGSVRNLTNTSGVAERYPAWSPDGKNIAYFSDKTGEYELYIRPGDGKGKPQQITTNGQAYRYHPVWAPNSEKLAFSDKDGKLFLVSLADKIPQFVDRDDWFSIGDYSWSSDSRWLTYSKQMENGEQAIFVYDSKDNKNHQVTTDFYSDFNPVFDPDGKYLYFYSNRTFKPIYSDLDPTWVYPNSTDLYAVTLRKDLASPLAPRSDEEEGEETNKDKDNKKKDKDKKNKDDDDSDKKEAEAVVIDFDGFEHRAVKLAHTPNVGNLAAISGKVIFTEYPVRGAAEPGKPSGIVKYFDLEEREVKTVIAGVNDFDLSANGKKLIYRSDDTYGIIDVTEDKSVGDGSLSTSDLEVWIAPREEWTQIFNEAWRLERDFFYDPAMHGVDWKSVKNRYAALLPYVSSRSDLNYVIGEMIGELNSSHTYVGGGDTESAKQLSVGLLGCDYEMDVKNNAFKISKIYDGAIWNDEVRSPLLLPGANIKEGDYLLAVNQQSLDTSNDPWAAFQGLADKAVTLTVNSKPTLTGAREVLVKPLSSEARLRNLAWIEKNRLQIEKATNGRVGYVYVPNTGVNGQNELVRQYMPQISKDAIIIDERFNSGGQIPDRFVELMNRPLYNYWGRRQHDWKTPFTSHTGPKVMLVNSWAGSGGDALPAYFRAAGLGPLVGTRTWGGLIGYSGTPQPIDGGLVTAPSFGYLTVDGKWDIEGHGVEPDYEVVNTPHEMAAGRDPQLEKAIEVILELLEQNPPRKITKPSYPNRSGMTKMTGK